MVESDKGYNSFTDKARESLSEEVTFELSS